MPDDAVSFGLDIDQLIVDTRSLVERSKRDLDTYLDRLDNLLAKQKEQTILEAIRAIDRRLTNIEARMMEEAED